MPADWLQFVEWNDGRYFPVMVDSIRLNTSPDFALYFRLPTDGRMVLYCDKEVAFTSAARERLEQNQIDRLFVREENRHDYGRYLARHLPDILSDPSLGIAEKSAIVYDSAQAVVEGILQNPQSEAEILRGKKVVGHTVELITHPDFALADLLRSISCDYYLYSHSVNVVAYSVAVAQQFGYTHPSVLREIANGALMHDIGKSLIPPAILNKQDSLSTEEWAVMREHPRLGYDLMGEHGILGEIALDIILHHHEKFDGTGYPDGISGDDISPFVHIVTLADIFDALTTDRYHQSARRSFDALKLMHEEMNLGLDRELLRAFIQTLGGMAHTTRAHAN